MSLYVQIICSCHSLHNFIFFYFFWSSCSSVTSTFPWMIASIDFISASAPWCTPYTFVQCFSLHLWLFWLTVYKFYTAEWYRRQYMATVVAHMWKFNKRVVNSLILCWTDQGTADRSVIQGRVMRIRSDVDNSRASAAALLGVVQHNRMGTVYASTSHEILM